MSWKPDNPYKDGKAVDKEFPPNSESVGFRDAAIRWVRAPKLCAPGVQLFDGIEPNNISQGGLGDCWLMGAIAAVAEFPCSIQTLFAEKTLQRNGLYTVKLYCAKEKQYKKIVIDDLVPCVDRGGKWVPKFSTPTGGEIWVLLLEKAFAKYFGSYTALRGGSASRAFQLLCGDATVHVYHRKGKEWQRAVTQTGSESNTSAAYTWNSSSPVFDKYELFNELVAADEANYVMTCSTGNRAEAKLSNGLVAGHAYSLINVVDFHGVRLLQLRNPWGRFEWKGDWGEKCELWKERPDIYKFVDAVDDGEFYMSLRDFTEHFHSVTVVNKTMDESRFQKRKKS